MEFVQPSFVSTLIFLALVVFVASSFVYAVYIAKGRDVFAAKMATAAVVLWIGFVSAVTNSGFVEEKPFPRLMLFFGSFQVAAVVLGCSRLGKRMSEHLSIQTLVGFQAFRLPLELVLHRWFVEGSIPETMTWSGANFDIVTGLLALVCFPFVNRNRSLALVFNFVGFALLINVIRVALMSSPLPFAWPVSPHLLLAFHNPYVLIAAVCVSGAFVGHIVLTRALMRRL